MNIVLIGMPGSGKSAVGNELSRMTGKKFIDTDVVIENTYGSIPFLFKIYGEEYFREVESNLVKNISSSRGAIISTGGGVVLRKENIDALKNNGCIFYMRASLDAIAERTKKGGERPLLKGGGKGLIEKLYKERKSFYEAGADFKIDTDNLTPKEIAQKINNIFEEIQAKKDT